MKLDNLTTSGALPSALLAGRFLLPLAQKHEDDPNWRQAGRWLLFWGLLIGILYAAVFRLVWKAFGEYQYIRFVPVAFVLAADLAFGGYRLLAGAVRVVAGRHDESDPPLTLPALLAVVVIAIGKYALLLSLPMGSSETAYWSTWRGHLGLLYPLAIYRPLILMPLWGRWAMTLAMSIGRSAPGCSTRLALMAGRSQMLLTMGYFLLCTLLTMLYTRGHPDRGLFIALCVLVASYWASYLLARRTGGQTEATVGATGLTAELVFLLLYVAVASRMYWY